VLTNEEIEARRYAARKREIVERLLPVVEAMLATGQSFRAITVEEIARNAGMARSSFYRYFTDKHELLIAICTPALEEIAVVAMRPWDRGADTTRESLEDELLRTMQAYRPHIRLLGAMIEASTYDAATRELFLAGFEQIRDAVIVRIEAGQKAGFIHRDIHARELAGWLTWMAERGMSELVPGADEATLRRLAESFAVLLWRTVYDVQGPGSG
jgi:AcrR family transcriptional regulator